ncbi:MAG: glycosyltransferase [Acidisphaera sp.]|nr:glycosyltransferase [Acidisphaera sp.]
MSAESLDTCIEGLTRLICGRAPTQEDYHLAEELSWNIPALRIRLLMGEETAVRFPRLRARLTEYVKEAESNELQRTLTLAKRGLPPPDLELMPPEAAVFRESETDCEPASEICLALIASRNYLPYAHVTMTSFRRFHADIPVFLLLVDGVEEDRLLVDDCTTVLLADIDIPNAGWHTAKYDASQLSNAAKPAFLSYLSRFASRALYLDADVAVFAPCDELIAKTYEFDLVLLPHTMAPFPRPEQLWAHPNNGDIFNAGLLNAGVFGIDLKRCSRFLEFWSAANFAVGAFYGPAGGQTDQQYLNWAIVLQERVHVLRDPAYNVAYWNLHERDVRHIRSPLPKIQVNNGPLVLFHFSGFDIHNTMKLSKHDNRYSVYTLPSIAWLLGWYRKAVLTGPHSRFLATPYRLDSLANGFRLSEFLRLLLKQYESYIPRYNARSLADSSNLCRFLMSPLPATGSLLPFVAAAIYDRRPDLQRDFPGAHTSPDAKGFWHWFCCNAGREYNIELLISEHRRVLVSDSLMGFSDELDRLFAQSGKNYRFLGPDRVRAADELRARGRHDLAESLLAGHTEWYFFSGISAVLNAYLARPDLQSMFPRIFGDSHAAFSDWLHAHARREHGIPLAAIDDFATRHWTTTLARIFNYLSRREDVAALARRTLLADRNEELVRELIRASGEGMEFDPADMEIFIFLHRRERELLVPVFLELPQIRRETRSPRVPDQKLGFLPADVRHESWAKAGCKLHAAYFDLFECLLEDEIKGVHATGGASPAHIFDVIQRMDVSASGTQAFSIAAAAARRRMQQHYSYAGHGSDEPPVGDGNLPAVNVFGFFFAETGVGESARGLARAIGCLRDVQRLALPTGSLQRGVSLDSLFHRYEFSGDTNVIVSYPHQHEDHFGTLPSEYLRGRKNVVHLAWEQKDWNHHWRAVYDRYDEIWTISHFSAVPFREMFGSRVRVVPNVLNFEDYPAFGNERAAKRGHEKFRFLFVFDANSSMERKNPEGCLDAFIGAFVDRPEANGVQLHLKIGNLHRPEHAARVESLRRRAAKSGLDIVFDGRQLTRDQVMGLIASADCYVSLHRAEGFGYTMAEAMYYGVPVIASNYSGNLEYMTDRDSFLVPCNEAFVREPDGPFQRGSVWGEPAIDAAIEIMRNVVADREEALRVGQLGSQAVTAKLSAQTVSEVLRPFLVPKKADAAQSLLPRISGQGQVVG